jgi:hypothetical protein
MAEEGEVPRFPVPELLEAWPVGRRRLLPRDNDGRSLVEIKGNTLVDALGCLRSPKLAHPTRAGVKPLILGAFSTRSLFFNHHFLYIGAYYPPSCLSCWRECGRSARMTHIENRAPISNQAGNQYVYGNIYLSVHTNNDSVDF